MSEAIAFPVIEFALIPHLESKMPSTPFSTEVPAARPKEFVVFSRIGGTRRDVMTDRPWVVFECWSDSKSNAAKLGQKVQAHAFALAQTSPSGGVWIRAVDEVGGLQYFPDPESGQARYQFSVQFDTRGFPLI